MSGSDYPIIRSTSKASPIPFAKTAPPMAVEIKWRFSLKIQMVPIIVISIEHLLGFVESIVVMN